tara:strand:- start:1498 stop:1728 length:231 start_codon:yes stop_codon:yes gene_type:complete
MKAKYAGKCKKTGRRFDVGDVVKYLGKGKGCELIEYADRHTTKSKEWDGNPFNDAGEPMMTATQYRQACSADDDRR